jgi:hypothetical protein
MRAGTPMRRCAESAFRRLSMPIVGGTSQRRIHANTRATCTDCRSASAGSSPPAANTAVVDGSSLLPPGGYLVRNSAESLLPALEDGSRNDHLALFTEYPSYTTKSENLRISHAAPTENGRSERSTYSGGRASAASCCLAALPPAQQRPCLGCRCLHHAPRRAHCPHSRTPCRPPTPAARASPPAHSRGPRERPPIPSNSRLRAVHTPLRSSVCSVVLPWSAAASATAPLALMPLAAPRTTPCSLPALAHAAPTTPRAARASSARALARSLRTAPHSHKVHECERSTYCIG